MMRGIFYAVVFSACFIVFVWGATLLGKWISYKFFYEAQVRETIHLVLHEEGLK